MIHEELKKRQETGEESQKELERNERDKLALENRLLELEPDYKAYHERQSREVHIELLEKKRDYLVGNHVLESFLWSGK